MRQATCAKGGWRCVHTATLWRTTAAPAARLWDHTVFLSLCCCAWLPGSIAALPFLCWPCMPVALA